MTGAAGLVFAAMLSSETSALDATPSASRVLRVGPGAQFESPGAAAAAARSGDVIEIEPGTYMDCAIWPEHADWLTITAAGDGAVVMRGVVCEYKAAFVIKGDNVTVRGITFFDAKAPPHNGAGIRAEGRNLTVDKTRFLDNEEGILAASNAGSTIIIRDSYFKDNGNCISLAGCAHGIYVNDIERLIVEHCTFFEQHIGHHIKSRAERTELIGNTIEDGPDGTASYLVDIPNGGDLIMRDNILEKGPRSDNYMAAITLGEEGNKNVTREILVEDNRFTNDMERQTVFLRNLTGTTPMLRGNFLEGPVKYLEEPAGAR